MAICPQCGEDQAPGTTFCVHCGARHGGVVPAPLLAGAQLRADAWQRSLPAPFNACPFELLVVCALMAGAGLLTLYPVVQVVPDIFESLGGNEFERLFGVLALSIWGMLAFFGGALLYLAWRLLHADRVARGLAYVLLGGLGAAVLLSKGAPTVLFWVMVTSFAAIAVLAFAPRVRTFFAGSGAPDGDQPTPVVVARTLVAVWSGLLIFVGVTYLPLSDLNTQFVWIGGGMIAIGAISWYLNSRLATGDPVARAIVSIGAAAYFVLLLVLGEQQAGTIVPLSLAVGVVFNLWIPPSSQRHFGRPQHPEVPA